MKHIYIILILLAAIFLVACQDAVKEPWQGTTITSISPLEGQIRDQIIIKGTNFKALNTNAVLFAENIPARIISHTTTELVVLVPDSGVVTGPIQVRVGVHEIATSSDIFTIDNSTPVIISVSPDYGLAGTTIEIKGANFSEKGNKVWFGDKEAPIVKEGSYAIKVKIPQGLPDGEVEIVVESKTAKSAPAKFDVGIIFKDNFDRQATNWVDANVLPNPIGTDWLIARGEFQLSNQYLASRSSGAILYTKDNAVMTVGNGLSYKYTADFRVDVMAGSCFTGLMFHAQDSDRFYLLRVNGDGLVQILATTDGGVNWPGVFYSDMHAMPGGDKFYQAEISCNTPGVFDIRILDKAGNVLFNRQIVDGEARYNGGFAGLWCLDDHSQFDNFSLLLK